MPEEFDINHLAKLAELELSEDEKQDLKQDLDKIFNYISILQQADLPQENNQQSSSLVDTAISDATLSLPRKDEVQPSQSQQAALKNAPLANAGQFIVPKVIGES